ncbi:hypothetical protein Bbelb_159200 [Branchiostoma belcheri]|nr:hypothetical protein Bbelb_159200 [Branchiostoma belcheri]
MGMNVGILGRVHVKSGELHRLWRDHIGIRPRYAGRGGGTGKQYISMELSRLHVVFFLAVFLSAAAMYHVQANQTKYMANSTSAVGQKFSGTPQRLGYRTNVSVSINSKNRNKLPRDRDYKHPPGGKRWNIFATHAMYNRTRFHQLMDPNTSTGICQPHLNVAFLKVHKCGSTTVANMIYRFGYKHKLFVALAPKSAHSIIGSFEIVTTSIHLAKNAGTSLLPTLYTTGPAFANSWIPIQGTRSEYGTLPFYENHFDGCSLLFSTSILKEDFLGSRNRLPVEPLTLQRT